MIDAAVLTPRANEAPLQAQESDGGSDGEVGIRLVDLSGHPTHTTVDRFWVELSNLSSTVAYQVIVSSDRATSLGIDGCGTASQTEAVTGVAAQTLTFLLYVCTEDSGTVTAEVRRTGASSAEASVSQRLTVLAVPEEATESEATATTKSTSRSGTGTVRSAAQVGTPGVPPNVSLDNPTTTSLQANWGTPSDGGRPLTGYGMLLWPETRSKPGYGEATTIGVTQTHPFTGLQHDTKHSFLVHACNGTANCGYWSYPAKEKKTLKAPNPHRPHTIMFRDITAESARVTWSLAAYTGGVPLTRAQIEHWVYDAANPDSRAGSSETPVDSGTARSKTLRNLAASTEYAMRMRSCNGRKDTHCSPWSDDHRFTTGDARAQPDPGITPDPTTPVVELSDCGSVATRDHTAPTGLNVIPLSGHQVRLTWTGSTDSTAGYTVEFNPHGSSWPTVVPASNKKEVFQTDTSTGQLKTCLDFSLDLIIERGPQDGDGIADNAAYDIRVRASKTVSEQPVEYVSETITIIDTPITKADGYVPESPTNPTVGQADVTWTAITSVLSNHYANGRYILRPRRLADHPASSSWRPYAYSATDLDDTDPTSATEDTIGGLTPDNIYAVQLIYLPDDNANTNDTKVFSARNVYVWPASTQLLVPGSGTSKYFARFPVTSLMANTTYDYFICTDTFTENADTKAAMDRRQAWVKFIYHALEQWRLATNNIVTMNYLGESCTDYQPIVEMAAKRIAHLMPTEESRIVKHLVEFVQHDWYSEILPANTADRDKNEIMMFDDYGDYPEGGTLYFAFTEAMSKKPVIDTDYPQNVEPIGKFGNRLGFVADANCWGRSAKTEAIACADPSKRASGPGYTTDIVLLRTQVDHDPLVIPGGNADLDEDGFPDVNRGDISYNKCPSTGRFTEWLPHHAQKNRDNSVYGTLVHEAGHALGIGHPLGIDKPSLGVTVSFKDTVMTPGKDYNCFPHPLDVLAVYALHGES